MNLDLRRDRIHSRNNLVTLNLRGTQSSALIAAVLGWNSTTHYLTGYGVTEAGPEEERYINHQLIITESDLYLYDNTYSNE